MEPADTRSEVLSAQHEAIGAEILHQSERTRVSRVFFAGWSVVRKEPLGPDPRRRLEHELAILRRLRGVEGISQVLEAPQYPESIVLEDVGGTNLAGAPLAADEHIKLAVRLARAVAGMHARGVMHRDITPANIILSPDGAPWLIDFALATSVAESRREFTHQTEILGTLAYLAPEQTGRTGRPVDLRADLYALGATLYELATGDPPFGTGDALRLTHHHLARVPVPPEQKNPAITRALSQIIMHLLEKEPDNRYQSAEGLLHDLERLRDSRARRGAASLRIGERDVPLRLLPPSRLVGRDNELAALKAAFEASVRGGSRGVLVGGEPGVGKTALVDELRPVVTARDGWFVAGKFDQYRRDLEFDAVNQAGRALARLLLAEPEDELTAIRERILDASGANAALLAATAPELTALLAVEPDPGDPLTAEIRAPRAAVALLRAVVSRERPTVLFLDDLQWAGRTPLAVVDLLLSDEPIEGLLLVCAYRDRDVDAAHLLAAPLSRWRGQTGVQHLQLENLPGHGLVTMVAEMLRVERSAAEALAQVIGPHTSGNPYETVELLNALRREGLLAATAAGWRWDEQNVRIYLDRSGVAELMASRVEAIPARARELVEAMACLGGRAELTVLQAAAGEPARAVEQALAPALDDGLLVAELGPHPAVRFRHDRIRETILHRLGARRRRTLHLAMARRLAGEPALFAAAAEQYVLVADELEDSLECRQVVSLWRRAAEQAALIGEHARVDALLTAALRLTDPEDTATLTALHTSRHAARYRLGRLDEADEEYRTLERLSNSAMERASATAVQVRSLTHRNKLAEAVALGADALRELGIAVPPADRIDVELDRQCEYLYRWLEHTEDADDLARPEINDPALLAAGTLIDATAPAAYFAKDLSMHAWLSLEALRIWISHGPGRTLVGAAIGAALTAIAVRADYAAGYRTARRVLAVGEARGYEPGASQARMMFAIVSCWGEPIENTVRNARKAREGLIAGGQLAEAGYAYHVGVTSLLDCGPTLDQCAAEIGQGLGFTRRSASEQTSQVLDVYRRLVAELQGEGPRAFLESAPEHYAGSSIALFHAHLARALAAALFDDQVELAQHGAAAMSLMMATVGVYPTAVAFLMHGLGLAERARAARGEERGSLLAELDEAAQWLAARAADAPDNFEHLLRLVEAERAWALGDFRAAVLAFDAALRLVAGRQRPWHHALIAERAARFYLAHGVDQAGYELLAQARDRYGAWGASAKVAQLDWAHPTLRARTDAVVTTGTIDLLGILSASQALSSETTIEGLHARVVDVLGAMTGATAVHLVLWSAEQENWVRPGASVDETTIPMSVLRYAQRTREPLLINDAIHDDRFARDPYFAELATCSLLGVPILSRGTLHAVLLLENHLIRGAFTADRLDAVKLVASQLAVSLANAESREQLVASRARIVAAADHARKRIERDLHDGAQQRVVVLGMGLRMLAASDAARASGLDAELQELIGFADDALSELRDLAHGVHPPVLSRGGLRPALTALAKRSSVPVVLDVQVADRLPEPVEVAAYYLVAEMLTNATKYASASRVNVTVERVGEALRVRVRDDGIGGANPDAGSGLVGLTDRVEAVGGTITIRSPRGEGTTLVADLPLANTADAVPAAAAE